MVHAPYFPPPRAVWAAPLTSIADLSSPATSNLAPMAAFSFSFFSLFFFLTHTHTMESSDHAARNSARIPVRIPGPRGSRTAARRDDEVCIAYNLVWRTKIAVGGFLSC